MYDDVQWGAFMHPPLTLMRNPADQVGRVAMELLFARLADRNRLPQEVKLQPTLVVRHSCGYAGRVEDSLLDSDAFPATTLAMPLGAKVS
jgi:DNA-binding LacI/PurR family transcriptional regulator